MAQAQSPYPSFFDYQYQGESFVNSATLFGSQSHFLSAYNAIQKKYFPSNDYVLKVGAFNHGHFRVPYYLDVNGNGNLLSPLFSNENLEIFHKSLASLISMIYISRALGGELPEAEVKNGNNTTSLHCSNGQVITTDNFTLSIYKASPGITAHLAKSFETIEQDADVTGIQIINNDGQKLIEIAKADMPFIAKPNPYQDRQDKESFSYQVPVFVKKVTFYRDNNRPWQWEFIYNGMPIKATIADNRFEEAVNKGRNFHKGTRLIVDLKKISKWEAGYQQYLVKGYEITKVYEGNLPAQNPFQQDLFGG